MTRVHPFDRKLRRSSLGTPGARMLRERTPRGVTLRILSRAGFKPDETLVEDPSGAGIRMLPVYSDEKTKPVSVRSEVQVGYTALWLGKILGEIQADDEVLRETRRRRDAVLSAAKRFDGALRSFSSGSVAHGTVIKPVSDADGGGVLDRRSYAHLGPDGSGVGPQQVVSQARVFILERARDRYPKIEARITKRAIMFTFDQPLGSGEDPSVDLVIALTRMTGEGLWIPNTEDDSWDASHPEKHTELLTGGARDLRVLRARVIRLAKGWIKQYSDPAISSFNLEALALSSVVAGVTLERSLADFFAHGAKALDQGLTPDPAGVSPPIKCPNRELAVKRLKTAAEGLDEALKNDDDGEKVLEALSRLFWDFVEIPPTSDSKEGLASAIRAAKVGVLEGAISTTPQAAKVKPVRSFGDDR